MPDSNLLILSGLLIIAAFYPAALVVALRRRLGQESAAFLLAGYALLALLTQVGMALWRSGVLPLEPALARALEWSAVILLAALLWLIARAFLRLPGGWGWSLAALPWAAALIVLAVDPFGLPETFVLDQVSLTVEQLMLGIGLTGWVVWLLATFLTIQSGHQRMRQPLHRNRISYWSPLLLLIIVNDALFFSGVQDLGGLIRLAAMLLLNYVVLTHDLPDTRQIMRRVLIYAITALLVLAIYIAGIGVSQVAFEAAPNYNPLLIGAGIALLLALFFTPLLGAVQRAVERTLSIERSDPGDMLRKYGASISNILEMERLATVAVGLIIEMMELQRGFLFLTDREKTDEGQTVYRLRAARSSPGERALVPGLLAEDSPIVRFLLGEQRPLLQYDIDLLPAFRRANPAELGWLARLDSEVYVPIFSKGEWIGLLALGAKLSGNRYSRQDLVALSALGNQTAVALENARLVDNLVRLNTELRQAYRALDKAKRDMERVDRTKSDFISIASHELRTPLTTVRGYTEMLLDDPEVRRNDFHLKTLQGIHAGTLRLNEIIDALFDVAQIDARALQLHLEPVDIGFLVGGVCSALAKSIAERQLTLTIDLPAMPLIKADPNILKKVFHHLATNAIKFTPNDGRIDVTGRLLAPSNELPDGGLEVVVSDTGIGVDPTYRDLIFTKFYQPEDQLGRHSSAKTRFRGGGAGLGLTLSRGIVEAHGGKIWVESPGFDEVNFPGSHFHVLLPLPRRTQSETVRMGAALKLTI